MKRFGEFRYTYTILNIGTNGGEWSDSRAGRFTSGKIAPGSYCIGRWVGPRAGLDAINKRKSLSPAEKQKPSVVQPVARRYTD
jgi:hypothetical protein